MTQWQRRSRFIIAAAAVGFAVAVASRLRTRAPEHPSAPVPRSDPKATIESTKIRFSRTNGDHEEVQIRADKYLGYDDGSNKLEGGVTVVTDRANGRTFTIAAKEAEVDKDQVSFTFSGDVQVSASDGMVVRTDRATYTDGDSMVRAAGAVTFSEGRMSGTGVGVTYDKNRDILTILDQAEMHMQADAAGGDRLDIASGTAAFDRGARVIYFDRSMKATREFETIEAAAAVAHLSDDEQHLEGLDLRGRSRVTGSRSTPGALKLLTGRDIDLLYASDGRSIQGAAIRGDAVIEMSAEPGHSGRQILANTIDLTLAPDGSVLTKVVARETVQLKMPADKVGGDEAARTVTATAMEGTGNDQQGLTGARFSGNVEFRERGANVSRTVRSAMLDVTTAAGLSTIEKASFAHAVRFEADTMTATAAAAQYDVHAGTLALRGSEPGSLVPRMWNEHIQMDSRSIDVDLDGPVVTAAGGVRSTLTDTMTATAAAERYDSKAGTLTLGGSEPGSLVPRMWNERIQIDGRSIDVILEGPVVTASGNVQSTLRPVKKESGRAGTDKADPKVPSMLKQDQPVSVTATRLTYDGAAAKATYTGSALLWQGETKIKGASMVIDDTSGDLTAAGGVTTTSMLVQEGQDGKKARVLSTVTAQDFRYEESLRRATYTGRAHLVDPQGDLNATTIELYLKPSGDEVDRAEAHEQVTLVENGRQTTGDELKYFSAEQRYDLAGKPVHHQDACQRESTARTLTLFKGTNKIIANSGPQGLTRTKSDGSTCP
jgi:LPS export ABC transporter protein LptC/lipopolysaccharide transport protein LptA